MDTSNLPSDLPSKLESFRVNPIEVIFLGFSLTLFGVSSYHLIGSLDHYTPLALVPMSSSPISEGDGAPATSARRISAVSPAVSALPMESEFKAEEITPEFDPFAFVPSCTDVI